MKVDVLQVPYDSGHRGRRMGAGPLRIVDAGLLEVLSAAGHDVRLVPIDVESDFPTEIASAFQIARAVKRRVADAVEEHCLPLILAGNCIVAVGAVAALGQPRVLWLDAHADLNTPDSTRSGFLDGMALSILLGRCWGALAREIGLQALAEDRIHLMGARDLDPAETEFLASSSVHRLTTGAEAADFDLNGRETCYLHVDLDVLDPTVGTANRYSVAGGIGLDRLLTFVERVGEECHLGAVALTAYDPSADRDGAVATAAVRIAASVIAASGGRARTREFRG